MLENEAASASAEHWPPPTDLQSVEVLVGIPAYNEEVGIGSTVVAANEHADCVVVVDDGSTDRTSHTAQAAGAVVLSHGTNRGKGAAIKTLLEFAQEIDCRVLVLLDGDGQHVPADIPDVVDPVLDGAADLVIGNRHHDGHADTDIPRYRRVGQRALDWLTRVTTGADVTDTQTGFRALSPAAIDVVSPTTNGMGVESEMIHTAVNHDLRIDEVPIDVRYDGIDGQTHNAIYHGIEVGLRLVTLSRQRALALVGAGAVSLAGATVAWLRSRSSSDVADGRRSLVAAIATVAFLLGVVAGIALSVYLDASSDPGGSHT